MEKQAVDIRGDTWQLSDLQEEIDWCKGRDWQPVAYAGNDSHVHCHICSWTIAQSDDPAVGQGYRSGPNSWLCGVCYGKFIATA